MKDVIKSCLFGLGIIATFMACIWLIDHGLTIAGDYLRNHDSARDIAIGTSLTVIAAVVITWLSVLVARHRKEMTEDGFSRQD